jgi:hypothetical protein
MSTSDPLLRSSGGGQGGVDACGQPPDILAEAIHQASASCSNCRDADGFTVEPNRDVSRPIETRAVSVAFLLFWTQHYLDGGETTAEVVAKVIRPHCTARQCRYARLILDAGAHLERHVGNATAFVSHAWKGSWHSLVDAIAAFDAAQVAPGHYWIDIFAVNQFAIEQGDGTWQQHPEQADDQPPWHDRALNKGFERVIQASGRTLIFLAPWQAAVPLSRCWCLFEFATTLLLGSQLDVLLSPNDNVAVRQVLRGRAGGFQGLVRVVNAVDLRKAEAWSPVDKANIIGWVEQTPGGFEVTLAQI